MRIKQRTRVIALALFSGLILSLASFFAFTLLADLAADSHRTNFILAFAQAIEKRIEGIPNESLNTEESTEKLARRNIFAVPAAKEGEPRVAAPRSWGRFDYWLVSEDGVVVHTRPDRPFDLSWREVSISKTPHELTRSFNLFRLGPGLFSILLDRSPKTYLVIREERQAFWAPMMFAQGALLFVSVFTSMGLAFFIAVLYLRRKSYEARHVLGELARGNLKVRFKINIWDEFGELLLDFNRMADSIENLVNSVQNAQNSRKEMLRELGHDLRTPLTSLTTTLGTLKTHSPKLSEKEKAEFFDMAIEDTRYISELIEGLLVLASIDNPRYTKKSISCDVSDILNSELKVRRSQHENKIDWQLSQGAETHMVVGDPHLLSRMFKNALDNAARYAKNSIKISIHRINESLEVLIVDDGPGLTESELQRFGKRQHQRFFKDSQSKHFSLGLGSIIMKTIAELHGGGVDISNVLPQNKENDKHRAPAGACLNIKLGIAHESL